MWNYKQPVEILFGEGRLEALGAQMKRLGGANGLLVCDPFAHESGLEQRILACSGGRLKKSFFDIRPNPTVSSVDACAQMLREMQADMVVALGGGSAMDCAKGAASMAAAGESIRRYHGTGVPIPPGRLMLIAIPTTAGTGAEVTCSGVFSDPDKGIKAPILSDNFYPDLALVDPELTYTVPKSVCAGTGMDVLAHALEGFMSVHHQPVCDAMALKAAELAFQNLEQACADPANRAAKAAMAEASVIAGLAFSVPKTGAPHACSFVLTNQYGIPHGEACGLTLDFFVRIAAEAEGGRLHRFARQLGFSDCYAMCERIAALKRAIGARRDLKDLSLNEEQLEALIRDSYHPNIKNSPVLITDEILRNMYRRFQ